MEKTRLYDVTIEESCDAHYGSSCKVATVTVRSKSANDAIEKALEKAKSEIESDLLFVGSVRSVGWLKL